MTELESKALTEFLLDIHCLDALNEWKDEVNIFDVLKVTNMEIRHSNILAWLLDPNENHGLGDSFLKGFVTRIVRQSPPEACDPFHILLQDFYTYQILREANHMDLVLLSGEEKTAIIIENKIWAGESPHQLEDYADKSRERYGDYRLLYVFLTPEGRESSKLDQWIPISYEEVTAALETAVQDKPLLPEVSLIVRNYQQILRKSIMKEADDKLSRICNEIYNKHRMALRLIFENVRIDNSAESEMICDELTLQAKEGKLLYGGNNKWSFRTEAMDEFLPPLQEPLSSWGTNSVYWYWLEKSGDGLVMHFELGGLNITPVHKNRMNALIRVTGKKLDEFKYRRLYYQKETIAEKNYEESLKKAVRALVSKVLQWEKTQLAKAHALLEESESN